MFFILNETLYGHHRILNNESNSECASARDSPYCLGADNTGERNKQRKHTDVHHIDLQRCDESIGYKGFGLAEKPIRSARDNIDLGQ